MARHGDYLFRRNGRFYARLRIPRLLHAIYGKPDLRVSLDTTDYPTARLRVLEVVLGWKRTFARMTAMLDPRQLVAGSPLLLGDGLIPLESAAREMGLSVANVLTEARNRAVELRLQATGWEGTDMPAGELEFEEDGSLVLNCAHGLPTGVVVGPLFLRTASLSLVKDGVFEDCLFFRDKARTRAVVVQLPGVSASIGSLLIDKRDAEAIRHMLASGITPEMLKVASARQAAATRSDAPKHKYAHMRASELLAAFFKDKMPTWSKATQLQMTTRCGALVELLGDPLLGDIDGALVLRYRELLAQLPDNIALARRKRPGAKLLDLLDSAATDARMTEKTVSTYVGKASEMFGWGVQHGFLTSNPAAGALKRSRKAKREQDEREPMSESNMMLIFSATWFATGRGERTAQGKHWSFQPHMYWLPLLAIFSGGRLNELAQLHLDDLKITPTGTPFIDFNLNQADKIEEPEKRLKTINSIRQVPAHPQLVRLGLLEYADALRQAGYQRLFPELRFDPVKGYGRQAGQWFNERFMGRQLGILRNGMQTFHSFRHTFTSVLYQLTPPLGEFVINNLTGHERGETMSAKRYAKDQAPDRLIEHVSRISYSLPVIAKFDILDGLEAIAAALQRKLAAGRR